MEKKRIELRFSGVGGQGVILAGAILAEAAVLFDNKYAIQSPTYTAQVRGGATKVDVVISPERITYPQTRKINFFMSLAQKSYDLYYGGNNPDNSFFRDLASDALVLVDSNLVPVLNNPPHRLIKLPIIDRALQEMGRTIYSNVIALGIIVGLISVVSWDALSEAVKRRAPKGTEEMNLKALGIGFEYAEKFANNEAIAKG